MSTLRIEQLPTPQRCGLCGRPTTRYSPELAMAFCGREEPPMGGQRGTGDFAPVMRGDRRRGRRGWGAR